MSETPPEGDNFHDEGAGPAPGEVAEPVEVEEGGELWRGSIARPAAR